MRPQAPLPSSLGSERPVHTVAATSVRLKEGGTCRDTDLAPGRSSRPYELPLISLPNLSILPLRIIVYRHLVGFCIIVR
jgi:hypothetical protein